MKLGLKTMCLAITLCATGMTQQANAQQKFRISVDNGICGELPGLDAITITNLDQAQRYVVTLGYTIKPPSNAPSGIADRMPLTNYGHFPVIPNMRTELLWPGESKVIACSKYPRGPAFTTPALYDTVQAVVLGAYAPVADTQANIRESAWYYLGWQSINPSSLPPFDPQSSCIEPVPSNTGGSIIRAVNWHPNRSILFSYEVLAGKNKGKQYKATIPPISAANPLPGLPSICSIDTEKIQYLDAQFIDF